MKRLSTILGGAAVALTIGFVGAVPAAAYSFEYRNASAKSWATGSYFCVANGATFDHSAVGCFQPNTDAIQPGDLKVDGKRVAVQWSTSYGRSGLCVNAAGKDAVFNPEGTQQQGPAQGKHECDLDFKEGYSITWKVGTCDASAHSCASPSDYGQWSAPRTRKTNA